MTSGREGVSVVLCCHNSEERIEPTLLHLARQAAVPGGFELVLVDNNCTDATVEVVTSRWSTIGGAVPLRVVRQDVPGQSAARRMGLDTARYDYVLFADDDNWLAPDYAARVAGLLDSMPRVGIVGGRAEAHFPVAKPAWFDEFQDSFAVGPQSARGSTVNPEKGHVYGAGMALRRETWSRLQRLGFEFLTSGRTARGLGAGEDVELCLAARLAGYDVYYCAELHLTHFMSEARLQTEYLYRLAEASGEASLVPRCYRIVLDRGVETAWGGLFFYYFDLARAVAALVRRPRALADYRARRALTPPHTGVPIARLLAFIAAAWGARRRAGRDWFARILAFRHRARQDRGAAGDPS